MKDFYIHANKTYIFTYTKIHITYTNNSLEEDNKIIIMHNTRQQIVHLHIHPNLFQNTGQQSYRIHRDD